MVKTLYSLWLALLNRLHLYTFSQHDKICETAANMYEIQITTLNQLVASLESDKASLEKWIAKLEDELVATTAKYEEVESAFDPVVAERDTLREQITAYKDAAMENVAYVKDVQKQLSKLFKTSEPFGFPNSHGIPGSTSIRTIDIEQDGKSQVLVRGRTIVPDDITKQINDVPDMGTRLRIIMQFMEKYGVFTKITRDLFSYGAARCVLGYNEDCTNYEMYYEILSQQANMDSILVVRNPDRKDDTDKKE